MCLSCQKLLLAAINLSGFLSVLEKTIFQLFLSALPFLILSFNFLFQFYFFDDLWKYYFCSTNRGKCAREQFLMSCMKSQGKTAWALGGEQLLLWCPSSEHSTLPQWWAQTRSHALEPIATWNLASLALLPTSWRNLAVDLPISATKTVYNSPTDQ